MLVEAFPLFYYRHVISSPLFLPPFSIVLINRLVLFKNTGFIVTISVMNVHISFLYMIYSAKAKILNVLVPGESV